VEDTEITIKHIMREEADEAVKQHFQAVKYVNLSSFPHIYPLCHAKFPKEIKTNSVWKPLRGPLHDWPLALCDASSLDADNDLIPADIVYPTYVAENLQVHYNSNQRWHYLSGQKPSEVLIFREVDSDLPLGPGNEFPPPALMYVSSHLGMIEKGCRIVPSNIHSAQRTKNLEKA
jgi:hypothetical protein